MNIWWYDHSIRNNIYLGSTADIMGFIKGEITTKEVESLMTTVPTWLVSAVSLNIIAVLIHINLVPNLHLNQ